MILGLYRALWRVAEPAVPFVLRARAARGKEVVARVNERVGRSTQARPDGTLIWIHGASVGECLAALPLVKRLLEHGDRSVLVTSGTVTSAQLMAERLPERAFHRFVPIDSANAVRRFLRHWRPDLALFVESELWPNLILETRAQHIPMALINARLSERSFRGWKKAPRLARTVLGAFDCVLAQDDAVSERMTKLGARDVRIVGSLKADAPPLPADDAALAALRAAVGTRPLFLAASTHPGEDEIILDVAASLQTPNLLTIIVPRHPARGEAIAELARTRDFAVARRAADDLLASDMQIYVADTLGELGLFYRIAPFVFLGGSLIDHGGQNPLEPARLGVAVLSGPYTHNFTPTFDALFSAQGMGCVHSREDLARAVAGFLGNPSLAVAAGAQAHDAAEGLGGALEKTLEAAEHLLAKHART